MPNPSPRSWASRWWRYSTESSRRSIRSGSWGTLWRRDSIPWNCFSRTISRGTAWWSNYHQGIPGSRVCTSRNGGSMDRVRYPPGRSRQQSVMWTPTNVINLSWNRFRWNIERYSSRGWTCRMIMNKNGPWRMSCASSPSISCNIVSVGWWRLSSRRSRRRATASSPMIRSTISSWSPTSWSSLGCTVDATSRKVLSQQYMCRCEAAQLWTLVGVCLCGGRTATHTIRVDLLEHVEGEHIDQEEDVQLSELLFGMQCHVGVPVHCERSIPIHLVGGS